MDWGFGFCHQEGREPGGFEILEEETHTLSTGHQHMQSLADGGTTGKASPPIGHNNPPPDRTFKRRWVTALFAAPKKPYGAISMAFKVYVEMDSQGRGASISDDEFRDSCGISDGSCRVFKKWLVDNEFIRIEVRGQRGRKSTFQATIPGEIPAPPAAISDEIPAANAASPDKYRQPSPVIEMEIPATTAAISGIAAPDAGILPASRAPIRARLEPPSGVLLLVSEEVKGSEEPPLPPKGGGGPTPLDALKAFEAYNEIAQQCGLPQAAKLTGDRQRRIIARLRDYGLEGWHQALSNIEKSAFLRGMTDHNFRADLDFMCQAKSFGRLHDGGYGNGAHAKPKESSLSKIDRMVDAALGNLTSDQQRRLT
jgi:hypothetical protein